MAWPNPFRRTTPNTRTCWGYTFEWSDKHIGPDLSESLKGSYDVLGEDCLAILDQISPPSSKALPRSHAYDNNIKEKEATPIEKDAKSPESKPPQRDLYALLRDQHEHDPKLKALWAQLNHVPDWVDWNQIQRGQDVFYRYAGPNLTGLAYQALLGGMGAARVVETLARTGGFSTKVARRRLFETTQHILQCTRSLESLQPGGEGFASSVRVRLLHAAVRKRIMKLAHDRPGYYNVEEWGIPINDLDSIATIASFSSTLLWLSLPRQGIYPRQQEIEDYVALWRYIAYIMGCPTEPYFETPENAKAVMEMLLSTEVNPSDTGKLLANNIIKSLDDQPPGYASADFLIAGARWLNGNELGDRLGLARPSWYYWALIAGQNLFFCVLCYMNRSIPSWDRRKITALKDMLYKAIINSEWALGGQETMFEFKYVPEYSTVTQLNDGKDERPRMRGVETRALKWLAAGVLVVAASVYGSVKLATGMYTLTTHLLR